MDMYSIKTSDQSIIANNPYSSQHPRNKGAL